MEKLSVHQKVLLLMSLMFLAFSLSHAMAQDLDRYREQVRLKKRGEPVRNDASATVVAPEFANGGFEDGNFNGWVAGDNGLIPFFPWDVCPPFACGWFGNNPIEGTFDAHNGFDGEAGYEAFLYQDIVVPTDGGIVSLWDHIQYDGFGIPSSLPRIYEVQIRDTSGNILEVPVHEEIFLDGAPPTDLGWVNRNIDVSSHAGTTIRVYIWLFIPEEFTGPGQIEFDDFVLMGPAPSAHVDIKAVPNPATVGNPLDILLDLANLGDGFDAKFRLWVLANGNVTTLVSISPFVDAGKVIDDKSIWSAIVPAGLPPVVGFLAAIFDAGSGELLDWDFESVGIGVAPSAADITALRQTATDFLNQNGGDVSAAPERPEPELNFNGTAKNPFEQRASTKGKLTTTWGRIKIQR